MKRAERRQQKQEILAPIYNMIRSMKGKEIWLNGIWSNDDVYKVKGVWNTRAFFLQDLKRFVPDDIEVIMAQKSGTFAKLRKDK